MAQDVATSSWSYKALEPIPPKAAPRLPVKLKASTTYALGVLLGPVTASPGTYAIYASGNVDGSQVPEAFLVRPCVTDASGNITLTSTAGQAGGEFGETWTTTEAFFGGMFNQNDLVGVDANALTALKARSVKGGNILMFG